MKRFFMVLSMSTVLAVFTGCGGEPAADKPADNNANAPADDHHANPPHGGTLTEFGGGKYHVEFTVDHDKKESVVYVLGSDGKSPAPIKTDKLMLSINEPAFQVDLMAQPLEGETDGMSSRFVGTHETLGMVQEFAGTVSGEVEGTPYAGDFKEVAGEHGHTH